MPIIQFRFETRTFFYNKSQEQKAHNIINIFSPPIVQEVDSVMYSCVLQIQQENYSLKKLFVVLSSDQKIHPSTNFTIKYSNKKYKLKEENSGEKHSQNDKMLFKTYSFNPVIKIRNNHYPRESFTLELTVHNVENVDQGITLHLSDPNSNTNTNTDQNKDMNLNFIFIKFHKSIVDKTPTMLSYPHGIKKNPTYKDICQYFEKKNINDKKENNTFVLYTLSTSFKTDEIYESSSDKVIVNNYHCIFCDTIESKNGKMMTCYKNIKVLYIEIQMAHLNQNPSVLKIDPEIKIKNLYEQIGSKIQNITDFKKSNIEMTLRGLRGSLKLYNEDDINCFKDMAHHVMLFDNYNDIMLEIRNTVSNDDE